MLKKKIENISSHIKCVRASEGHDPIVVGLTPGSPTLQLKWLLNPSCL